MLPTKILAGLLYMYRRDPPLRWRWLAMEYLLAGLGRGRCQVILEIGTDRQIILILQLSSCYSHYWSKLIVEMVVCLTIIVYMRSVQ